MSPAQANPSPPLNSGPEEQNRDFDVSRQEQTKPPNGMKRARVKERLDPGAMSIPSAASEQPALCCRNRVLARPRGLSKGRQACRGGELGLLLRVPRHKLDGDAAGTSCSCCI